MAMEFNDANFEQEVLKSDKAVFVDFFTPQCGPCRKLAPTIEKLAEEFKDQVVVGKMDVSENHETGMNYRISAVPTLKIFKGGKEVANRLGMASEEDLRAWIEKNK